MGVVVVHPPLPQESSATKPVRDVIFFQVLVFTSRKTQPREKRVRIALSDEQMKGIRQFLEDHRSSIMRRGY